MDHIARDIIDVMYTHNCNIWHSSTGDYLERGCENKSGLEERLRNVKDQSKQLHKKLIELSEHLKHTGVL